MVEVLLLFIYSTIVGILLLTYILYPFISKFVLRSNDKEISMINYGMTYIIIPAYNEEKVIKNKIKNTLKNMGSNSKIIVVSDASDDKTNSFCQKMVEQNDNIQFYINEERGGKNVCINHAVEKINPNNDDILIFTDCNTFFDKNSLSEIRRSLLEGSSLVAGSMVYESMDSNSAVSEGLYWKYEEWLRRNESVNGRLIVSNGGLFGMWASYFKILPSFVPNDFEAPLRLCGVRKHVTINPKAKGIETAISSSREEYSRKQRMANRQMNCILYLWKDLNIGTKIQVLFHKLFRWFGFHLFLITSVLIILLALISSSVVVDLLLTLHLLVVLLIIMALINQKLEINLELLPKILHAVKVHIYGARGAMNAIYGDKTSIWEKAKTNR